LLDAERKVDVPFQGGKFKHGQCSRLPHSARRASSVSLGMSIETAMFHLRQSIARKRRKATMHADRQPRRGSSRLMTVLARRRR
jgi:hypothetical protein